MSDKLEWDVLSEAALTESLDQLTGWENDGKAISKLYDCPSFLEAIAFVNRVERYFLLAVVGGVVLLVGSR